MLLSALKHGSCAGATVMTVDVPRSASDGARQSCENITACVLRHTKI